MTGVLFLTGCQPADGGGPGFFNEFLVQPFTWIIEAAASLFNGNYGWAIILITLLIRLALMPLMIKQYKNQQDMKEKMNVLKPEMDKIQKQLKQTKDAGEQKKLQAEMFALYQKHGVNPLSAGCLPMLIQMPVLMGFYYAIRGSADIASHSFLWFSLGQADLIITAAAGIVYFLQFKFMQADMPDQQKQQMKLMGLVSPAMIVIFSLNAPAAMPLYWVTGGLFLIFQSWFSRKLYKTGARQHAVPLEAGEK